MNLQNQCAAIDGVGLGDADLSRYITRMYSDQDVRAAGRALAGPLPYTEAAVHNFRVAHNFRMAHAAPLMLERTRLSRLAGGGADTAGRIKRMASIRKKLAKSGLNLDKMQDIAGIRAILPDMAAVRSVMAEYQGRYGDTIKSPIDYIAAPKASGYRSAHIIKTYEGSVSDFVGMKVEIQLRTRLQHIWATAQETVGILSGDDLKGGEGDPRWLRLMVLMSAYMAEIEGENIGTHVPLSRAERQSELAAIDAELGAVAFISGFSALSDGVVFQKAKAGFFLLSLDADRREVKFKHISPFADGAEEYFIAAEGGERLQSLLVAADSAEALLRAYPSYFLDITEFLGFLRRAIAGDYSTLVEVGPKEPPYMRDLAFLKGGAWRGKRGS